MGLLMIYSLSAKYALLALIKLASTESSPVLIKDLAESTGVPYHYLSKVMQTLVKRGIIRSTRGRRGGLSLSKPPDRLFIGEVVEAVDGSNALDSCLFGAAKCGRTDHCSFHPAWEPVRKDILNFLEKTSIGDLSGMPGKVS